MQLALPMYTKVCDHPLGALQSIRGERLPLPSNHLLLIAPPMGVESHGDPLIGGYLDFIRQCGMTQPTVGSTIP